MRTPPAEVNATPELVRRLLREQHPDLAELPVTPIANGWDNSILALGERMCVRMPRREAAAQLLLNEQRWLPGIAERVGVPVSAPLRTGVPGRGYPWHWSVNPWFEGRTAAEVPVDERSDLVGPLARFLSRLHTPAPEDAPRNRVRGVPLRHRDARVRERLTGTGLPRAAELLALWEELVDTPAWTGPALWLHGDLHPANILVGTAERTRARGRLDLAAVLDFGDLTSGDPATDLAVGWLLLGPRDRARLRAELDRTADDDTWNRARAWAVLYSTLLCASAPEHPLLGRIGAHAVTQLLGTEPPHGAVALITNPRGEFLLHLRDDIPGIAWPGRWSVLGGGRDPWESPRETIVRELDEEAGLAVGDLVELFDTDDSWGPQRVTVFAGTWDGDARGLPLTEGVRLDWVHPADMDGLDMPPFAREAIRRHLARA